MGLFDAFKKKKSDFSYPTAEEERFWRLYAESLQLKDGAMLSSALAKREEALNNACIDDGYKGMACHNLAILYMYHIGNGQMAVKYALDSLAYGDDYYRCSQDHLEELQFGAHLESLQTVAMTASSYDEALRYVAQGEKLYGDVFRQKREEYEGYKKDYPRFYDYQRDTSFLYYSRVSAEQDHGDYAPAMSILQLILDRAENPNYDLSYEEYVDLLDDYGTITCMYLMKKARIQRSTPEIFARELGFIADEPLKRIAEFMSDCEPGDRQKFGNIVQAFGSFPGIQQRESYRPFL